MIRRSLDQVGFPCIVVAMESYAADVSHPSPSPLVRSNLPPLVVASKLDVTHVDEVRANR